MGSFDPLPDTPPPFPPYSPFPRRLLKISIKPFLFSPTFQHTLHSLKIKMPSSSSSTSEIIKNRFLGFLIWQSIWSTTIFTITKSIFLSPLTLHPYSSSIFTFFFFSFLTHLLSLFIFSVSLSILSSPRPDRPASLPELASGLVRFLLNSLAGGAQPTFSNLVFRRRLKTSLGFFLFIASSALSGCLSVVSLCRNSDVFDGFGLFRLGFRGFVFGLLYGVYYVYYQRWVLVFPIIQRPPFFSFKMRLPSAIGKALKLSSLGYLCSAVLLVFLPDKYKSKGTIWQFLVEQTILFVGSTAVSLCWELSHHLHQILHTKRCFFAPPKGSAAAETNPSEPLLVALEVSTPRSLLQYLAYLDLCMVCESNVDTWRRAAFFEETGETYKRVITVCLRPLEELMSNLVEGLEGTAEKTDQLSHQLRPSPTVNTVNGFKLLESFNDFQMCVWCARSVSALTVRSHKDDRFGVAQLVGCNAEVVTTLLSCLLAVEACMGKKTNLQAPNLVGPATIKWATVNTGRRDTSAAAVVGKKRSGPLHSRAYAMADVFRTSIYAIASVFHDEMIGSAKSGNIDRDWITGSKPLYGTRDMLIQKLNQFLDFRA